MNTVNLKINNIPVVAPEGATILEAAHLVGIRIPTLCYLKEINAIGACRICVVRGQGRTAAWSPPASYPVERGHGGLYQHPQGPATVPQDDAGADPLQPPHATACPASAAANCELQQLCREYGVDDEPLYQEGPGLPHRRTPCPTWYGITASVSCAAAVWPRAKRTSMRVSSGPTSAAIDTHIGCAFDMPLAETACVACGQCIAVCPTGALRGAGRHRQGAGLPLHDPDQAR